MIRKRARFDNSLLVEIYSTETATVDEGLLRNFSGNVGLKPLIPSNKNNKIFNNLT